MKDPWSEQLHVVTQLEEENNRDQICWFVKVPPKASSCEPLGTTKLRISPEGG